MRRSEFYKAYAKEWVLYSICEGPIKFNYYLFFKVARQSPLRFCRQGESTILWIYLIQVDRQSESAILWIIFVDGPLESLNDEGGH